MRRIAFLTIFNCLLATAGWARPSTLAAVVPHASISDVVTDRNGYIYMIGTTGSRFFSTTANALKRACEDPCYSDAVFVKLDARGKVLYATHFGGSSNETGNAIAVDQDGFIYLAGTSWSADFPVTNAMVTPRQAQQGFVTKLSPEGRVVFSTTIGGEGVTDLAVDREGAMHLTGSAYSESIPMVNAIQPVIRRAPDVFVAKLRPDGAAFVFSTYLGGSATDSGLAVAVDPSGHTVVCGYTSSDDFPVVRAVQPRRAGGINDAFVAKLAPDGSLLVFSTFIGGRNYDSAVDVAVDRDGTIYLTGTTDSPDFPVTEGAFDSACGRDGQCDPHRIVVRGHVGTVNYLDAFVTGLTPHGEWVFSTFLGGDRYDEARALAVGDAGSIFVVGFSTSTDFAGDGAGECDFDLYCAPFVVQIDRFGSRLEFDSRAPFTAGYAPYFDKVVLALEPAGTLLVGGTRRGVVYLGRMAPRGAQPPEPPPRPGPLPDPTDACDGTLLNVYPMTCGAHLPAGDLGAARGKRQRLQFVRAPRPRHR